MSDNKPTVLITGCSDGGLGAALALAFHAAGFHVYATARDVAKMAQLCATANAATTVEQSQTTGMIETLSLDVQSAASIADCVARVKRLDILVNNAGALLTMPVADVSIAQAKDIFDINVWGVLAVTQAFLPLLLESARRRSTGGGSGGGIVAVNTSVASTVPVPFYGVYSASKAAMAMFCDTMRLELDAFGVHVVELKTGAVGPTRLVANNTSLASTVGGHGSTGPILPEKSIYAPARGGGRGHHAPRVRRRLDASCEVGATGRAGPAEEVGAAGPDVARAERPFGVAGAVRAIILGPGLGEEDDQVHASRGGAEAGSHLPGQRC
ncbi:hypothetical protein PG994_004416 [Apiospora phragmitis]|uniref:Uncharacterized protein n=1 Tax=Apiospora phragmitis TaxID=2905665 RepID=A0ABR1VQM8_9PEZI